MSIHLHRYSDDFFPWKKGLLFDALKQSHRLEEVSLTWDHHMDSRGEAKEVLDILQSSAPFLRHLSCVRTQTPYDKLIEILPASLFNNDAPQLTTLSLTGYYLPWSSGLFRHTLTSFSFILPFTATSEENIPKIISTSAIIGALAMMSSLVTLTIQIPSSFLSSEGEFVSNTRNDGPVLPSLKKLDLKGGLRLCTSILDSIRPLGRVSLLLSCVDVDDDAGLQQAASSIQSLWFLQPELGGNSNAGVDRGPLPLPLLTSLHIQSLFNGIIKVVGDQNHLPRYPLHKHIADNQDWHFDITLASSYGAKGASTLVMTFLYLLPLQDLESLSIEMGGRNGDDNETAWTWCGVLSRLASLKEVNINSLHARSFLQSLKNNADVVRSQIQSKDTIEGNNTLYLPSLQSIQFFSGFGAARGPLDIPIDTLGEVLKFRMERGLPKLSKIRFDVDSKRRNQVPAYDEIMELVDHIEDNSKDALGEGGMGIGFGPDWDDHAGYYSDDE